MTAVFSRTMLDFSRIGFYPRSKYARIFNLNSILGRTFDSIILIEDWYRNPHLTEAYDALIKRQPELSKEE